MGYLLQLLNPIAHSGVQTFFLCVCVGGGGGGGGGGKGLTLYKYKLKLDVSGSIGHLLACVSFSSLFILFYIHWIIFLVLRCRALFFTWFSCFR